ncbi:MAG: zinc ribbon domain-containing protein [Oscillospiraceae bacterium]|nr:zinc ribbon domain-containing protein [Oscillospiraceae bacterium]
MAWDREKEKKAGKAMTIGSSIFGTVFAIFWCVMAASMGAWFMLIFGIPFVGMMVYRLYICIQYSKGDNNKAPQKEADLWDRPAAQTTYTQPTIDSKFCPYCGAPTQDGFEFCPKCGRRLP